MTTAGLSRRATNANNLPMLYQQRSYCSSNILVFLFRCIPVASPNPEPQYLLPHKNTAKGKNQWVTARYPWVADSHIVKPKTPQWLCL